MIGKRGAARTLAKSAHEAFLKYKTDNQDLSEAEIAEALFKQRCSPANLNRAEKLRFDKYLETKKVDSLFTLCMAMIYIMLNISETDVTSYNSVKKIIEYELAVAGHKTNSIRSSFYGCIFCITLSISNT